MGAAALPATATTTSVVYNPTFTATGVNMWGNGASGASTNYFFGTSWNEEGSIGSIKETFLGDYGARVYGSTSGEIGINIGFSADAGHLDVTLPYQVTLSTSSILANAGTHSLNIAHSLNAPAGGSYVRTTFASADYDIAARIRAEATVGGEIAVVSRTGGSVQLIDIDTTVPLLGLTDTLLNVSGGEIDIGQGISIPLPLPLISATPKFTRVATLGINPINLDAASGTGLTTSVSQADIISLDADVLGVAATAAGLPFNPLDIRVNLGIAHLTGTLLSASVGIDLGLAQHTALDPRLGVILRSSVPLTYDTPGGPVTTNALVVTDLSQAITFSKAAGDVSIFPEFFLSPTLRNDFDFLLGGSYDAEALAFSYSIPSLSSGSFGPLFSYSVSGSFPIGVFDQTFNVTGTGLNQTYLGQSLTTVAPTVGNIGAQQNVAIPGLVGNFSTSSIGGSLRLSNGSLYLNNAPLTIASAGALTLATGSGATANRLTTPGLSNLGRLDVGTGSTVEITSRNGFSNVDAAGTLSGGTFDIDGTLTYKGPGIVTNSATLSVAGAFQNQAVDGGPLTNALATLATNSPGASLTLEAPLNTGRAFTNGGQLVLNNDLTTTTLNSYGTLIVNGGHTYALTSANGWLNVDSAGQLTNGTTHIAGSILYTGVGGGAGRTITSIGSGAILTLHGASSDPRISHSQSEFGELGDALSTLTANRGTLGIGEGMKQTLAQSFTNSGSLWISGANARLTVEGNFTNSAGHTTLVSQGTLQVDGGQDSDRNFTNRGTLQVTDDGSIEVDGMLGNFTNVDTDNRTATLSGGTWNVGGMIAYGTGETNTPNIREIDSGTTVNMLGGEIYNQFHNESALSYLAVNRGTLLLDGYTLKSAESLQNTGSLTVSRPSGWLGFQDYLTNTGTITIGSGATLSTLGRRTFSDSLDWANVDGGGMLSGIGNLTLAGRLEYKGAPITGLAQGSNLTLSGPQWRFARLTGDSSSITGLGLSTLAGSLNLVDGARFETPVGHTFTLTSTGRIATTASSGFVVTGGATLLAQNNATIANDGILLLRHTNTLPASFGVSGNVALTGTGSLQLSNFSSNAILDSGGVLTNSAGHSIIGAGQLRSRLVNRGTIESHGSAGLSLTHSSGANVTNSGLILAGGSLDYPLVNGVPNYSSSTFVPSLLTIHDVAVANSEGATAGRISSNGALRIANSTVTGGKVDVRVGAHLTLDDATLQGGQFEVSPYGKLDISGGRTRLGGTSLTTGVGSTLTLLNNGIPGDPAILELTGTQPLVHHGQIIMQPDARIEGTAPLENHGSLVAHLPGVSIIGANFRNTADGVIDIDQTSALRWTGDAHNAGRVFISASGGASASTLSFPVNSTLSGGGTIQLGGIVEETIEGTTTRRWVGSARITSPNATSPTLTNVDNTLSGSGTIGDTRLGLVNQAGGTFHASAAGATFYLNPGPAGLSNAGLLRVAPDARLEISTAWGPFHNLASGTLTGGRYESAGTLALPGPITTNAADLTLLGNGVFIDTATSANALSGLATNASGATLRLQSGAALTIGQALANSGTLVLGGADALAGGTFTAPGLTGAGAVTLADPSASLVLSPASGTSTTASVVTGSGRLVKEGAGTVVLTGANTFSGGTTVSAGTLQVGAGGTEGSLAGNVVNNATLAFNRSDALAFGGVISGPGALIKVGAGTLTLAGASTYTGATAIGEGTLALGASHRLADSTDVTLSTGATLNLAGFTETVGSLSGSGHVTLGAGALTAGGTGASTTFSGVISGTGSFTKTGAGTLTLTGNNTATGTTTISAGTLQLGHGGTTGTVAGAIVNHGALVIDHSGPFTLSGALSGAGTFRKTGAGALVITAANTHSGPSTLAGGTLIAGHASALGTGDVTLSNAPVSLVLVGDINRTLANAITVAPGTASATIGSTGSGSFVTYSGDLALHRPTALHDSTASRTTFDGVISGDVGTLTIGGVSGGRVTLGGTNTFTGRVVVSNGVTLQLTSTGNQILPLSTEVETSTSGRLWLVGANTLGSISGGFGSTVSIASGGGATAALSVGANNLSTTFAGTLQNSPSGSGALSLDKIGSGTLTLTGTSTYIGGTTVSEGTLRIGGGGTTGSITGNVTNHATLRFDRSNASSFSGVISGTGAVTKTGLGALTLTGANTYTGGTTVSGGSLHVGNGGTTGSLVGNVVNHAALVFARSDQSAFDGVISGAGTVTKSGAGTLKFTGAHTYTGATHVSAGLLIVNGSATGSAFTVAGGTLGGSGTVGTLVIASGGTLAPGNSPGTLNAGSTTWAGGGAYVWEINDAQGAAGTNWDTLAVNGALTISGTEANPFVIQLVSLDLSQDPGLAANFDASRNYSFTLTSATGGIVGYQPTAFALDTSGFANALNGGVWSVAQNGNQLDLVFTAIPEPSAATALLGLAALGFAVRRRRSRPRF